MLHGILNVYKEKGYTSFDVVAKLRGICGQKKIGHTGTLDPDAEGVLPVCLGKATKVCDLLTERGKEYRALMRLGVETDTQDMSGTVLSSGDTSHLTSEQIRQVCLGHLGLGMQIPPMYSALKINGQKLCDLARKGETLPRAPRPITIYELEVEEIHIPLVRLRVRCSKGTYIRTLCHDIGRELGCGASLQELLRTEAAGWRVEDARTLAELQELQDQGLLETVLCPIDRVFADLPAIHTLQEGDKKLYNGNALVLKDILQEQQDEAVERVRVYDSADRFQAVYGYDPQKHCYVPIKMFLSI